MKTINQVVLAATISATALSLVACARDEKSVVGPQPSVVISAAGFETLDSLVGSTGKLASTPDKRDSTVGAPRTDTITTTNGQVKTTQQYQVQSVRYNIATNASQFMMYDANSGIVYPGSLVQGNTVAGNAPSAIGIPDSVRRPLTVTMNIMSGAAAAGGVSRTVNTPNYATMQTAMTQILAGYKGGTPGRTALSISQVYSASQFRGSIALGYEGAGVNVDGKFTIDWNQKKTRFLVSLVQQYFTMAINATDGPSGMWDITKFGAKDLRPYSGPGNPVTYISSVTYGRAYYLLYESDEDAQKMQAALNFSYTGVGTASLNAKADYEKTLSSSSVKLAQMGGDPVAGLKSSMGQSMSGVTQILAAGANFDNKNIGVPLSFVVLYLSDNTLVKLANTMDYTVDVKTPIGSPVTNFAQSKFNLSASKVEAWGYWMYGDGSVQMSLKSVNDSTGQTSTLWTSPCTRNCDNALAGYQIGETPWHEGAWPVSLDWTSGSFYLDNRSGFRIRVECKAIDVKRNQTSATSQDYEWNDSRAAYVAVSPADPKSCTANTKGNDMNARFTFNLRINGTVQ
jgi:hypothetical protein